MLINIKYKKHIVRTFLLFLMILSSNTFASDKHKIAIVIDDIGYRASDITALDLPSTVTFSVLPHTPYGRELAIKGNLQQRDILLHVPMESTKNLTLGPGALTVNMNEHSVQQTLERSFADIPHVIGVNNHMGSRLTQMSEPMSWTMDFLKKNNLFFLDSRTSKYSQAEYIAKKTGIPSLRRHVFLDNQIDEAYIEQQFEKLIAISKKEGGVIAIGHPHPETLKIIHKMLPTLSENNIELVSISDLLPLQYDKYARKNKEPQQSSINTAE